MIRSTIVSCAVLGGLLVTPRAVAADSPASAARQAPAQVSPAEAEPFLGEWTLVLQGPNGPGTFGLSIKVEKEKVAGEIAAETMPKQAITDISKDRNKLVLAYTFPWEGNPVDAVVSLTPGDDGKMAAQIDFAGGAYVMTGAATKKDTPK